MKTFLSWLLILNIGFIHSMSLFQKRNMLKRLVNYDNELERSNIGCIHMASLPGEYWFTSPGAFDVCGLYLIGLGHQLVQIEFSFFDIDCASGGLLAVFDGWELQGEYFPSAYDHPRSDEERYAEYCLGGQKPPPVVVSSQNVALLQYRIPKAGQGFRVKVTFPENPMPCNMVAMADTGTVTLQNFGRRLNCSVSMVNPEVIAILNLDVGETGETRLPSAETGVISACDMKGRTDHVELLDGSSLDPRAMWREDSVCGLTSEPGLGAVYLLGCQHSVVRLVSSGRYFNSITFHFSPLSKKQLMQRAGLQC